MYIKKLLYLKKKMMVKKQLNKKKQFHKKMEEYVIMTSINESKTLENITNLMNLVGKWIKNLEFYHPEDNNDNQKIELCTNIVSNLETIYGMASIVIMDCNGYCWDPNIEIDRENAQKIQKLANEMKFNLLTCNFVKITSVQRNILYMVKNLFDLISIDEFNRDMFYSLNENISKMIDEGK